MVTYEETRGGSRVLIGDVSDFGAMVLQEPMNRIKHPACVNGTFFWWTDTGAMYSTSPLKTATGVYQYKVNHPPYPQSCIFVGKDGSVTMRRITHLDVRELDDVRLVIGGVGLINNQDDTFAYNPYAEGFKPPYHDVLRRTSKTILGYDSIRKKILLICRPHIAHSRKYSFDLLDLAKSWDLDLAISVDGGGSTFMNDTEGRRVIDGDGRSVHNILGFDI